VSKAIGSFARQRLLPAPVPRGGRRGLSRQRQA
jgi:hypothetical protein